MNSRIDCFWTLCGVLSVIFIAGAASAASLNVELTADAAVSTALSSSQIADLQANVYDDILVTGAYRLTADVSLEGYTGTWTIQDGSLYVTQEKGLGTGKVIMQSRGCLEFNVSGSKTFVNDVDFTNPDGAGNVNSVSGIAANLSFAKDTTFNGNITSVSDLGIDCRLCSCTINGSVYVPNGTLTNKAGGEGKTLSLRGKVTALKVTGNWNGNCAGGIALYNPANSIATNHAHYGEIYLSAANVATNSVLQQGASEAATERRGRLTVYADQVIDRITWPSTTIVSASWPKDSPDQKKHLLQFSGSSTLIMRGTVSDSSDIRLRGIGSFGWAPVERGLVYTLDRSRPHDLQGRLIVSNGTLRVNGTATFLKLTGIEIGEYGTFDFDLDDGAGDGVMPEMTSLVIGANGRADFKDFTPFTMAAVTIRMSSSGFLTMKPGTYRPIKFYLDGKETGGKFTGLNGSDEVATRVDWLDDDVVIDAPMPTVIAVPRTWDAGGGTDTAIDTAANWDGDVNPDFSAGSLLATFGAGDVATFARNAVFKGLVFNRAFAFTPLTGGAISITEDGITVNAGTFTNDVETTVSQNQSWTVASGAKLIQNAPLKGADSQYRTLTMDGPGDFDITGAGAASDFAGTVRIENGSYVLHGEDPLGTPGSNPDAKIAIQSLNGNVKMTFDGVKIAKPVEYEGDNVFGGWLSGAGKTNEFTAAVKLTGTHRPRFSVGANKDTYIFSGGFNSTTVVMGYSGHFIFRDKPAYFSGQYQDVGSSFTFETSGNFFYCNTLYTTGAKITLNAPYALKWDRQNGSYQYSNFEMIRNGATARHGAGVIELCGYPQTIGNWFMDDATVDISSTYFINSSDTPSDLHMIQTRTVSSVYAENLWLNDFKGRINLYKEGAGIGVVTNVAVSAVGDINVAEGSLRFAAGGKWQNAATVTVAAGAKLSVVEPDTFSRRTDLALPAEEAGVMTLANAAPLVVHALKVGDTVYSPGLYGGSECLDPNVPDGNKLPAFAGGGSVLVRGTPGLMLLMR